MNLHTPQHAAVPSLFMQPAIFNDTMELLHEAQDYFQHYGAEEQSLLTPTARLIYTSEMSRVTLRLSSVMAWLLARRASVADDKSPLQSYSLQFRNICLTESHDATLVLSSYMQNLLARTYALYTRVARLDDMIAPSEQLQAAH